jgi:TIR domain
MGVFISYSHVDTDYVLSLTRLLEAHKIPYFLDSKDIMWGSSINDDIRQAFDNAEYLIVVLSPASLKSTWVPYEIGLARGKNIKILPILIHPSLDLPSYIGDIKYLTSLNEVEHFLATSFFRQLRLRVALKPGHAMPMGAEAKDMEIPRGLMGIRDYSIEEEVIPQDKLPHLAIVVTNNESREVELEQWGIEFSEEIQLNPNSKDSRYDALMHRSQHSKILRPGGTTSLSLPVEFNAVVTAFCTEKVKGVFVEDNQSFRCYASFDDVAKAIQYFEKFFLGLDVDELRLRYAQFL